MLETKKASYHKPVTKIIFIQNLIKDCIEKCTKRKQDYSQKKAAYEQIYHKKLTYEFHDDDIAGWRKE